MHQYSFDQTLTNNLNLKQMYHKLEQALYCINGTPLLQNQMVLKNQDQDNQLDSTPKSLPKLNKTIPFTTENS